MDLTEYRTKSRETWDTVAAGWFRERHYMWEASRAVGEWLVDRLSPKPGETILELAAGIGDTGFLAAQRIGSEGRLISTDFAPQMVDAAREHGAELGLDNVEYRVLDAENMELTDDSVNGVLCRWGYMAMADPAAAFRETRRVLREGGRLTLATWAAPESNPWAAIAGGTLVERGHLPMPEEGDPGMFSLADPDKIRELLDAAGFRDPEIEQVAVTFAFDDFEQYWRFITELAGAVAMAIKRLDGEERDAIGSVIEERAGAFSVDGGYRMPGLCNCVATN